MAHQRMRRPVDGTEWFRVDGSFAPSDLMALKRAKSRRVRLVGPSWSRPRVEAVLDQLVELPFVEALWLTCIRFVDGLQLSQFQQLSHLYLEDSAVTKALLPGSLGKLAKLEIVGFATRNDRSLLEQPTLEEVRLRAAGSFRSMEDIGALPRLRSLTVGEGAMKDLRGSLGDSRLESLTMIHPRRLGSLSGIGELKALRTLVLEGDRLGDLKLTALGECPWLRCLVMHADDPRASMLVIAKIRELRVLRLFAGLSDAEARAISRLPHLRHVSLGYLDPDDVASLGLPPNEAREQGLPVIDRLVGRSDWDAVLAGVERDESDSTVDSARPSKVRRAKVRRNLNARQSQRTAPPDLARRG